MNPPLKRLPQQLTSLLRDYLYPKHKPLVLRGFTSFCCISILNSNKHKHAASRKMQRICPIYAITFWEIRQGFLDFLWAAALKYGEVMGKALQAMREV